MISAHIPSSKCVPNSVVPDDGLMLIDAIVTPYGMVHGIAGIAGLFHVRRPIDSELWEVKQIAHSDGLFVYSNRMWYMKGTEKIMVSCQYMNGKNVLREFDPESSTLGAIHNVPDSGGRECVALQGILAAVMSYDTVHVCHMKSGLLTKHPFPYCVESVLLVDGRVYVLGASPSHDIGIIDTVDKSLAYIPPPAPESKIPGGHALAYLDNSLICFMVHKSDNLSIYSYDNAIRGWNKIR